MTACTGTPPHVQECFAPVDLPCPRCGVPVRQWVLACGGQRNSPPLKCDPCALLCRDCPSEVRGGRPRWRVVHAAGCPWLARHLAGEVAGMIPCGATVTHRGPYVRRPAA